MKKKGKYTYISRLFIIFVIGFFACSDVFADDTLPEKGLQISPLRYDWKIKAGETRTDDVIVHNFSDVPHEVQIGVEDFYISNDSNQANFFVPEEGHDLEAYDVINWIDVPENFTLEPDETKKISFNISVPENQPTNGYYGAIFFKTRVNDVHTKSEDESSVDLSVNYRVGALITLAVQGDDDMQISGALKKFDVARKIFWKSPIEVYAKIGSKGNVHYKMGGRIEVYKFGKKFTTVIIEPEVMYPDKMRTFIEKIPFGSFDHGIYSAVLEMESEDSSIVFESKTPFFVVIPWVSTTAIVSVIVFVIILIKLFKRRYALVKREDL